jgi:acyl transferase domain-containing protein
LESEEGTHLRCSPTVHPLLGVRVGATKPTYEFYLDPRLFPYLDDHRFWDSIIFPASGYGEIGLALCRELFPDDDYCVEELQAKKALFISESKIPTVRVVFDDSDRSFSVYSNASKNHLKEWELNAQGRLRKLGKPVPARANFEEIKSRMVRHFDHEAYYQDYLDAGYQFGPNFQHLQNVWRRPHESIAEIVAPAAIQADLKGYRFHPAVLDALFHGVKGAQVVPDDAKGSRSERRKGGRARQLLLPIPLGASASPGQPHQWFDSLPDPGWGHRRSDEGHARGLSRARIEALLRGL